MSYSTGIPNGSDPLLQSQQQLRANYQAIARVWANNHYPLTGDNDFQGMHTVLRMRAVSAPVTDATHIAIFNQLVGVGSIPTLTYAPNSAQTPIELTYSEISTGFGEAEQYSFVAGPFVVYGGKITGATNNQVITLTPTTTLLYVGLVLANVPAVSLETNSDVAATNVNVGGTNFTINFQPLLTTPLDCYYLAIGQ